jgi:hypothetical protein
VSLLRPPAALADYAIPAGSPSVMGRKVMINDLQRLFVAVRNAGIRDLKAVSVYRSYKLQASVYNSYVRVYGVAATDRFSARPGHSQHQLGTAIDFSTTELGLHYMLSDVFVQTKAGQWLMANAYKYGFYTLSFKRSSTARRSIGWKWLATNNTCRGGGPYGLFCWLLWLLLLLCLLPTGYAFIF